MGRVWLGLALGLAGCLNPNPIPMPTEAPVVLTLADAEAPPAVRLAAVATNPTLLGVADRLPDVAEAAVQSVVSIASRSRSAQGIGSGVIVHQDGIVVTNNHVVEGARQVVVGLPNGESRTAAVVGTDPRSDLAVLRIEEPPAGLVALPLGNSDDLRLGEVVLAVGTPFGIGQTVTMGIVSAKGRSSVGIVDYEDFIQTDAAINPGNSGGALVNLEGSLVGINTAIFSRSGGSQGIGFAIPTSMVTQVVNQILEAGVVRRGWLGVGIKDLTPDQRAGLGVSGGVLISGVEPRSPAAAAGFRSRDVVVSFQGESVEGAADFRNAVAGAGAGVSFKAQIVRQGQEAEVSGTLGELPTAG